MYLIAEETAVLQAIPPMFSYGLGTEAIAELLDLQLIGLRLIEF